MSKPLLVCGLIALSACVSACQSAPTRSGDAPPASPYREKLDGSGALYALDPAASKVMIYVFRGGAAAQRGHNHVLNAPKFEGRVLLPSDNAADAQFSLRFVFDQLQIDWDALRTSVGGNFADPRSEEDIAGTQRNMLKSLDADRYPELVINSVKINGDWPILVADVEVSMHGVSHRQNVMLKVQRTDDEVLADGNLVLLQSDFGVQPFSILGGLLAVQDPIAIEFELVADRVAR